MTSSATSVSLVSGLPVSELDRRLRGANLQAGLCKRALAFYLCDMERRGVQQQLGFPTVARYGVHVLQMTERRVNELLQFGHSMEQLKLLDAAFLDGRLGWSKARLLARVVQTHTQADWIEHAMRRTCAELEGDVARAKDRPDANTDGFPRPAFQVQSRLSQQQHDKFELIRLLLMRERNTIITDDEVIHALLDAYDAEPLDSAEDAIRQADSEDDETPESLRIDILARDAARCRSCASTDRLHVHHIVFRSRGGKTTAPNLISLCRACHGLVHADLLHIRGTAPDDVEFRNDNGELLRGTRVPALTP